MEKATSKIGGRTERSYMHWTNEMDIALSNALLEQHNAGHKTPNGWKSIAFTAAMTALKDICGVDTSKEKVMARLKTWNKYYIEVSAMLNTSGFGWDWDKNIVKVDSEDVWENYVKAHPGVKHYKDKVIVNWSDLDVLCGQDKANGSHAATPTENINEIDAESIAEQSYSTHERTRVDGEGSSRKRKKKAIGGAEAVAASIDNLAATLHAVINTKPTSPSLRSSSNVDGIFNALARIPDLNRREVMRAMDMLSYDSIKHDIFMTLPDDMKVEWLRMQFDR